MSRKEIINIEKYVTAGNVNEALTILIPYAEKGDNEARVSAACLIISIINYKYIDISPTLNSYINMKTAIKYIKLAASSGDKRAKILLDDLPDDINKGQ